MTSDRETTRVIREWAREFETQLPDRVLDAVLDQLPVTPQRRRGPLTWAFTVPFVPISVAAAAIVLAALVGLNVLGNRDIGGPEPSARPTAAPQLQAWSGREMPAGDYVIGGPFPVGLRITVPDGWQSFGVTDGLASLCNNACELPDRAGLAFWVVTNTFTDACDIGGLADPPIGPSVDDLVDALASLPRHEATAPTTEAIGGRAVTYLELTADADLGDCGLDGFRAWTAGAEVRESPPGDRDRLWILEVDGTRLMVDIALPPSADPQDVADLEAMVESIRFEPGANDMS